MPEDHNINAILQDIHDTYNNRWQFYITGPRMPEVPEGTTSPLVDPSVFEDDEP